jgi:hypothetical protein
MFIEEIIKAVIDVKIVTLMESEDIDVQITTRKIYKLINKEII